MLFTYRWSEDYREDNNLQYFNLEAAKLSLKIINARKKKEQTYIVAVTEPRARCAQKRHKKDLKPIERGGIKAQLNSLAKTLMQRASPAKPS